MERRMTNAEKYKDAIMAQMCRTASWAVTKNGEIMPCDYMYCTVCKFSINQRKCAEVKKEWLNAEVKKAFSEKDKEVIRALDKVQWVARDKDGRVCAYTTKPFKNTVYWDGAAFPYMNLINCFSTAEFAPVKWEDDEPTSREEILGEEE